MLTIGLSKTILVIKCLPSLYIVVDASIFKAVAYVLQLDGVKAQLRQGIEHG